MIKGEPELAYDAPTAAIEREPGSKLPRIWMTITLGVLGRTKESKAEALQLLELDPTFSITAWTAGLEFKDPSWSRKLEQNLREAGLPD